MDGNQRIVKESSVRYVCHICHIPYAFMIYESVCRCPCIISCRKLVLAINCSLTFFLLAKPKMRVPARGDEKLMSRGSKRPTGNLQRGSLDTDASGCLGPQKPRDFARTLQSLRSRVKARKTVSMLVLRTKFRSVARFGRISSPQKL